MIRLVTRRAAALFLLACGLLVIWMGIAAPGLTRRVSLEERIAQAESAARRFTAVLEEPRGEAAVRLPDGLTLTGESQAISQAMLQERLDAALETSGGTRTASTPLDPARVDDHLHLRARVEGELTISALADLLYELETGLPLIFVEELDISRQNLSVGNQPETKQEAQVLDLRLTISSPLSSE